MSITKINENIGHWEKLFEVLSAEYKDLCVKWNDMKIVVIDKEYKFVNVYTKTAKGHKFESHAARIRDGIAIYFGGSNINFIFNIDDHTFGKKNMTEFREQQEMKKLEEEIKALEARGFKRFGKHLIRDKGLEVYRITTKKLKLAATRTSVIAGNTYFSVNSGKTLYIQRLRWEAFNGKLGKDDVINFKDGDRTNLNLDNLEVISRSELSSKTIKETLAGDNMPVTGKRIFCNETGFVYANSAEACRALGIHISRRTEIRAHVIGRQSRKKDPKNGKYYTYKINHIKGYTFREATPQEIDNEDLLWAE